MKRKSEHSNTMTGRMMSGRRLLAQVHKERQGMNFKLQL